MTIEVTQQLTPTLVSSGPIVSLCFLSAIQETKGFELFQVTQTFANLHLCPGLYQGLAHREDQKLQVPTDIIRLN